MRFNWVVLAIFLAACGSPVEPETQEAELRLQDFRGTWSLIPPSCSDSFSLNIQGTISGQRLTIDGTWASGALNGDTDGAIDIVSTDFIIGMWVGEVPSGGRSADFTFVGAELTSSSLLNGWFLTEGCEGPAKATK